MQMSLGQVCSAEVRDKVKYNVKQVLASRSCVGCDLEQADFTRMDLSGVNLEGADLRNASFFLSDLTKANLKNSNLNGARFGGADLSGCDLRGAVFDKSALSGAYIATALLDADQVKGRVIQGIEKKTDIPDAVVIDKDTVKKSQQQAVESQQLDDRDQKIVDKVQSKQEYPEEELPKKMQTKVATAPKQLTVEGQGQVTENSVEELEQKQKIAKVAVAIPAPEIVNLHSKKTVEENEKTAPSTIVAKNEEINKYDQEEERDENSIGESGHQSSPEKAEMVRKMLKNKRCYKCDLTGMRLNQADFEKFDLEGTDFTNCYLQNADFQKANLKGASFIGANLNGADFRGADLYKADFSGADLSGAKLEGALLDGAVLTGVKGYQQAE